MPTIHDMLEHPTDLTTDRRGYQCDSTSSLWKQLCMALPCMEGLAWPGYDTKVVESTLDGEPIIIQLWKGYCPQFFGRTNFPGGIGGEVGVYRRMKGRKWPRLDFLSPMLQLMLQGLAGMAQNKYWWPDPELQPEIDFTLFNRKTQSVLLHVPPEKTYWSNRWMQFDSYRKYEKENAEVPTWATEYKMVYTIDGKTRAW